MKTAANRGGFFICVFISFFLYGTGYSGDKNTNGIISHIHTPAKPYKKMLDDDLSFTGISESKPVLSDTDPVSMGLFVPDDVNNPAGQALIKGAMLALTMANQKGGYQGRPFKRVIRWADSPWSAGSQEMIRFAYQDNVVAVITYLSAASHIAEQIALKTYLPVITPVATDTTLTHARVPWIFRLPPDDHQQAEVLVKKCLASVSRGNVGLITATDQDSRMAAKELEKEMIVQKSPPLFHHVVDERLFDFTPLIRTIKKASPDGLILRLKHTRMADAITSFRASGIDCPIFVPWIPGTESVLDTTESGITMLQPFQAGPGLRIYGAFAEAYLEMYHEQPLPSAAYGFDAMQLLITAVQAGGTDRVAIRNELVHLSGFTGATGRIAWDTGGGNTSPPSIRTFQ